MYEIRNKTTFVNLKDGASFVKSRNIVIYLPFINETIRKNKIHRESCACYEKCYKKVITQTKSFLLQVVGKKKGETKYVRDSENEELRST